MRTTLTLDDRVHAQLKVRAARDGVTVSSVIEEALRRYFLEETPSRGRAVPELPTMQSGGVRPGVDLDDMSSVVEILDEGVPLNALR